MSSPKHTPAWERVVTLDDHDALRRELAEERTLVGLMAETMDAQQDIIKRLAEALKDSTAAIEAALNGARIVSEDLLALLRGARDAARAALREAGVTDA